MFDLGGWNIGFWLMVAIDIAAVAILGLAILYGSRMWRKRSQDPKTLEASDEATWRLYHPEAVRAASRPTVKVPLANP